MFRLEHSAQCSDWNTQPILPADVQPDALHSVLGTRYWVLGTGYSVLINQLANAFATIAS